MPKVPIKKLLERAIACKHLQTFELFGMVLPWRGLGDLEIAYVFQGTW
jgi:hypothetical protein